MNLEPIIRRALDRTDGMPNEQRAIAIVQYIDIAQDLAGVAPAPKATSDIGLPCNVPPPGWTCTRNRGHEGPCAALPDSGRQLIVTPDEPEYEPPPRIKAKTSDSQVHSIDDLERFVKTNTPVTIDVDLGDGGKPLRLGRSIQKQADAMGKEGDGIVRLAYSMHGEAEAPTVVFSSGDTDIDIKAALAEIRDAVKCQYSRQERAPVQPRPAKQFNFSHADGVGGNADDAEGREGEATSRLKPLSRDDGEALGRFLGRR